MPRANPSMRLRRAWRAGLAAAMIALLSGGGAAAKVLVAVEGGAPALALLEHLGPRFWLKTQIGVDVGQAAAEADLLVAPLAAAEAAAADAGAEPVPVFRRGEAVFAGLLLSGADDAEAKRFLDWLGSSPAAHAIESFEPPDGVAFSPDLAEEVETATLVIEATPAQLKTGETIAYRQCGRCHVIGERNKYGGIGSTPSFPALRGFPNWRERFQAFWNERPHISFTQIEGVTPPFDPRFPPAVMPVELTLDDVDAVLAYVTTLKPKDLGAPIKID